MIDNKSVHSKIRIAVIHALVILSGLACLLPLWNIAVSYTHLPLVKDNGKKKDNAENEKKYDCSFAHLNSPDL